MVLTFNKRFNVKIYEELHTTFSVANAHEADAKLEIMCHLPIKAFTWCYVNIHRFYNKHFFLSGLSIGICGKCLDTTFQLKTILQTCLTELAPFHQF